MDSYFTFDSYDQIEELENTPIELSDAYISSSTQTALIIGIIAGICIIAAAFLMNKNKVIGILAGVFAPIGAICGQKAVISVTTMDMFRVVTGTSTSELEDKLMDAYMEMFMDMIPYMLFCFVYAAAWALALVFVIKSLKMQPKALPLVAMILHILVFLWQMVRYMVPLVMSAMDDLVEFGEGQLKPMDTVFNVGSILVVLLVLIAAILTRVNMSKKPVPAATGAAPVEATATPVVEATATAAPVEEAPVETPTEAPAEDGAADI